MTTEETRSNILEDDDFVMTEFKKLQYLHRLKFELRYNQQRTELDDAESVAEHVYGMHVLADYFYTLESADMEIDQLKAQQMITAHDIGEIETGDIVGYDKTTTDRKNELAANDVAIAHAPEIMQTHLTQLVAEYEEGVTATARFVKAVDRLEPSFYLYRGEIGKQRLHKNKVSLKRGQSIKGFEVLDAFPYMKRFLEVSTQRMVDEGYFYQTTAHAEDSASER